MKRKILFWLLVMTSVVLLTACTTPQIPQTTPLPSATLLPSTQTPEPSATLDPTENAQATLHANATQNAVHFETAVAAMTATALVKPTNTPFLTQTPSLTPTPTQPVPLTSREPTLDELADFLGVGFDEYFDDGKWVKNFDLVYEDVTGDGQTELVFTRPPHLYVLKWDNNQYQVVFTERGYWTRGLPNSSIALEDWTQDGISEIIFDNTSLSGGSGWFVYDTVRKVIHCDETNCQIIWSDLIGIHDDLYAGGILERYRVETNPLTNENGEPILRTLEEGFSVNHLPEFVHDYRPHDFTDGLYVFTSTVTLYAWNGVTFEPAETQIVSLPQLVSSDLQTTAIRSDGTSAEVIIREQLTMDFWRENCQVVIDHTALDLQFPCSDKFTKIEWLNVVGDAQEEVVLNTFSGLTYEQSKENGYGIQCQYQRLLIFQPTGDTYTLIANITGCIEESDLYGVRLEDVNGDGQFEIRSRGTYWGGPELLYTFNGTAFTLSAELP